MDYRVLTEAERKYTFSQSQQLSMQTGLIGYLRADFGSNGNEFWTTWNDFRKDLKTDEFKAEFDEVINGLRDGDVLSGRKAMGRTYESMMEELEVIEILSTAYDGDEFPGYENIRLSFSQLETIIRNKRSGWLDALRNQKAVYLITDTSNGKMYVGSATAQYGMLLQRWTNYIDNGHGGNVELKHIVDTKGFDYIKANFQYSVLENYNARMDDNYILSREKWWKDTLCTRQFGYNKN